MDQLIEFVALAALPVLFAITLHEAAHGYVARHFGDLTAERAGRISLNPMRHIDPIGTVLFPLLTLAISQLMGGAFVFGWAKPTPINFSALRRPKQDMAWVALAGPAANLVMALGWALLARLALGMAGNYFAAPLYAMAAVGIQINALFMVINLIPLPPLDGGRVAISLLPYHAARQLARIEPYGIFILIILVATPVLGSVLWPAVRMVVGAIKFVFGL